MLYLIGDQILKLLHLDLHYDIVDNCRLFFGGYFSFPLVAVHVDDAVIVASAAIEALFIVVRDHRLCVIL